MEFRERPILITGAARSGTSMIAGLIHHHGVFGGSVKTKNIRGDINNPKPESAGAMYENLFIRNNIVKKTLREMNLDPKCQNPLPDPEDFKLFSENSIISFRSLLYRVLREQGYKNDMLWYYKGAKCCLMWPWWHRAFPAAKWIIVRRRTEDIVNSCLHTHFMNGYKTAEGWEGWVDTHIERFLEMGGAGLDIQYIWPHKIIGNDFSEIKKIVTSFGLKWDEELARDFIEPALWGGKKI